MNKSLWTSHILKISRRIGKLETAKIEACGVKVVPLFGYAIQELEYAVKAAMEAIRIAALLAYIRETDQAYSFYQEQFQMFCARFSMAEHKAFEAVKYANSNKERARQ